MPSSATVGEAKPCAGTSSRSIVSEQRRDPAPEIVPAQDDLLIVHAGLAAAEIDQPGQCRSIFGLAGWIRALVRDSRLDAAEREPVLDNLLPRPGS